jgi:hypothetical protein
MREPFPISIVCSDLHLSHKAPSCRAEKDWYEVQARYLKQLDKLAQPVFRAGNLLEAALPVIIAGDIFDDGWRPGRHPPELTSFALNHLPKNCWTIPGQHDLPHHNLGDIYKSAYWTLVRAGKIRDLFSMLISPEVNGTRLYGFPWGIEPKPLKFPSDLLVEVAVVHKYIWKKGTGYPGAPEEARLKNLKPCFNGYDAVVVGDNHIHWQLGNVFNCGCFIRRKRDEIPLEPSVGILYSNGSIIRHKLDTSEDRFVDGDGNDSKVREGTDFSSLIEELKGLADKATDFADALNRELDRVKAPEGVRKLVLKALGGGE